MSMSDEELREWADEHLYYEITTLEHAIRIVKQTGPGPLESVALQSFIVNTRCLNDFLWGDRKQIHPNDMFATDFCDPTKWRRVRERLPQPALRVARKRFNREVMHLTRKRISGYGKDKEWSCGPVFAEIAGAMVEFVGMVREGTLGWRTISYVEGLPDVVKSLGIGLTPGVTAGTAVYHPSIVAGGKPPPGRA